MSRRKQFKPRHFDSEDGEISGEVNCPVNQPVETSSEIQKHPTSEGIKGLNPISAELSETEGMSLVVR